MCVAASTVSDTSIFWGTCVGVHSSGIGPWTVELRNRCPCSRLTLVLIFPVTHCFCYLLLEKSSNRDLISGTQSQYPRTSQTGVVCECVRIESAQASYSGRACSTSVARMRVRSHQQSISNSLRGWRSQERGGSNPPFRTKPNSRFCVSRSWHTCVGFVASTATPTKNGLLLEAV